MWCLGSEQNQNSEISHSDNFKAESIELDFESPR